MFHTLSGGFKQEDKYFLFHAKFIKAVCVYWLLSTFSACSLAEIHRQTSTVDTLGTIRGKVSISSYQEGPVRVLRFWDEDGIPVLESWVTAKKNGDYEFRALPGKHYIAAFIDTNNDEIYQPQEHGIYYGAPSAIEVKAEQMTYPEELSISGPIPQPSGEIKAIDKTLAVWKNVGKVTSLDDPRFSPHYYGTGLWRPLDFLEKAEGGLFFLEEYQQNKIPVVFVHGVLGGPAVWKEVVEALDKDLFQPWLLYYPTGLRLDMTSSYLVESISRLQKRFDFKKYYLVAHSMGGLVARSFVKKYIERAPENEKYLNLVITINSPMAGMAAAAAGVKRSPIVVPSWRDVEPESDFLKKLHTWNWPKNIPYHLVISYIDGESGDGLAPLQSQAQPKLQAEAARIYLFNDQHARILGNEEFHVLLNGILSRQRSI